MSSDIEARARLSGGASDAVIYRAVEAALRARIASAAVLLDVGCGSGGLWKHLAQSPNIFSRYVGVDVVRYDGFPADGVFCAADLAGGGSIELPDGAADVVAAVETIEHLENPRSFARELVRLARPGGWIVITTPNQLNLSSLLCLAARKEYAQFQSDGLGGYPAHITALLETDLTKIARENGLLDIAVEYTNRGRIPFTARPWPGFMGGRWFSDNLLMIARKAGAGPGR
jgi:SAM-dependent methyltransferase